MKNILKLNVFFYTLSLYFLDEVIFLPNNVIM